MAGKRLCIAGIVAVTGLTVATSPAGAESQFSYVEPAAPGVSLKVLATAGDMVNGALLPGTPDGIGLLRDGTNVVVFTNHELSLSDKVAAAQKRAGGAASGSTVSAMNVDTSTMTVTGAKDLLGNVSWWDYQTAAYSSKPGAPTGAAAKDSFGTPLHGTGLNRLCSSHMSQPGDLAYQTKDAKTGKVTTLGYSGPVYFTGEEGGDESRAFAMDTAGNLVQLPRFGLAAWENFLPAPKTGRRTVVMMNEDGSATDSQAWMYVGEKTSTGGWADKAGLTNGQAYVMSVTGIANDNAFRASAGKNNPKAVNFMAIDTTVNGAQQNAQARSLGTIMSRVEDGSWDPKNPNNYYFVTTESNKDPKATAANPQTPKVTRDGGALWRLTFNDVQNPLAGATLTMLLDGSEAPYLNKPDNIDVDEFGNVLIQEDPGNNDHVSRVVAYRIADGKIATVAKFKDQYFVPGAAQFITKDEESSGIVDATRFMRKSATDQNAYYIFDAQVHVPTSQARIDLPGLSATDKATIDNAVEGGQWYVMTVPDWAAIYNAA